MMKKIAWSLLVFVCGFGVGNVLQPWWAHAQMDTSTGTTTRVFEIRTYTATEGKLEELHARFRDHTLALFEKHGITSIGYFKPQDPPLRQNTLVYILAHPSREAATKNWEAFHDDPEWKKVKEASEEHGPLTTRIESVFAEPTDYSPMQ